MATAAQTLAARAESKRKPIVNGKEQKAYLARFFDDEKIHRCSISQLGQAMTLMEHTMASQM
jgi:hypothetical protein